MSIFAKPVSKIDLVDVQELLQERAVENVLLEFKSEVPDIFRKQGSFRPFSNSLK